MADLTLKIVSPQGEQANLSCDSVRLMVKDNAVEKDGGWVGIRQGHVDALMAVEKGPVLALRNGQEVGRFETGGGFASVKDNVVTVIIQE